MAAHPGSTKVIYAALAGNPLIALTKFSAILLSGSSAMLSEGSITRSTPAVNCCCSTGCAVPGMQATILAVAGENAAVERVNGLLTVHLGPDQIEANLSVEFADHPTTPEIEACVECPEARVTKATPEVSALFVKPRTAGDGCSAGRRSRRVRMRYTARRGRHHG
jgi:divalent metal cation (Fe/Co/Zn/Cd) transporter